MAVELGRERQRRGFSDEEKKAFAALKESFVSFFHISLSVSVIWPSRRPAHYCVSLKQASVSLSSSPGSVLLSFYPSQIPLI